MRPAAIVLLLALSQAGDPDRLVKDLSLDDIPARERAAERLGELGAKARPAVEKLLKSPDPELKARAQSLLEEIALGEGRRALLGPPARITLPAGERTFEQIAAAVREQSGVTVGFPAEAAAKTVQAEAKGLPLWEFLDRVSRAHGGFRPALSQPAEAVGFEAGPPAPVPVFYTGPFKLWVERLRIERHDSFDQKWARGVLVVGFAWPHTVRTIPEDFYKGEPLLALREIKGDDGKPVALDPRLVTPYLAFAPAVQQSRGYRQHFFFEPPGKGVRKLQRIRGTVDLHFPVKRETVEFEIPQAAIGQTKASGPYAVKLENLERLPDGLRAKLHIRIKRDEGDVSKRQRKVELRTRFRAEDVTLLDANRVEHRGKERGNSHSDGFEEETLELGAVFPLGENPLSLKVDFLSEFFDKRIEFEFRDLELP